jgi:hypothetical protein
VKQMKPLLKLPTYFLLTLLLYFNVRLYHTQSFDSEKNYDKDAYAQLQHLKNELHNHHAAMQMQGEFPEGFVFMNSLYGLTWCDLIQKNTDSSIRNEALAEIDWALDELSSQNGTYIFQEDLPLKYGVFYRGWTNYLLGKRLELKQDSALLHKFKTNCDEIAMAYNTNQSPYLESYYQAAWPADNVVAMASLAIQNKFSTNLQKSTLESWLKKVKTKLDQNGRIPHRVDWETGESVDESRGNSMSLMLCLLQDIDSDFAQKQFDNYKTDFLDARLGLPGVREHAKGVQGNGDIDSGPVIWGIGGAASIVGQRTMATYAEWNTFQGLRNSIESFGAAYTLSGKKKYVFGQLPMADVFIAWSNVSAKESEVNTTSNWRWKFQLGSLLLVLLSLLILRKIK